MGRAIEVEEPVAAETFKVIRHDVSCTYCGETFDLFSASWCSHKGGYRPSKRCSSCARCLCEHPSFRNPRLWADAPPVFRHRGFPQLFVLYL